MRLYNKLLKHKNAAVTIFIKVARLISGGGHNPQAECKATGIFPLMASVIKGDTIALEKVPLLLHCRVAIC